MVYEELTKNVRNVKEKPIATIGSGGVVYLNTFIMRTWFQGIKWVKLFFDNARDILAVKPLKKEEENSFRLTFSSVSHKSTGVVAARSAIKRLKIDYSKTKQYEANWNKKEGMLEIQLDKDKYKK